MLILILLQKGMELIRVLSVYLLLDFTLSKREVIPDSVTVKGATHRINEMARVRGTC